MRTKSKYIFEGSCKVVLTNFVFSRLLINQVRVYEVNQAVHFKQSQNDTKENVQHHKSEEST